MRTPTNSRRSRALRAQIAASLTLLLLIAISSAGISPAQSIAGSGTAQTAETGNRPDLAMKGSARVNPHTLALEFSLSLMTYPGRNGNDVNVAFNYSSKVWRMDPRSTWWYPVNTARKYVTDLNARYAERTAAGWTSALSPPVLEEAPGSYDQYGQPLPEILGDDAAVDSLWNSAVESGSSGLMASPNVRCVSYQYTYCPDCVLPDGSVGAHIYVCNGWEIGGGIPEPGGPAGTGGGTGTQVFYFPRVFVTLSDGSRHEFRKDDTPVQCGVPGDVCDIELTGTFFSTNATGMRLERAETGSVLFLPNGSRYYFPASPQQAGGGFYAERFEDVNGNLIEFQRNENGPAASYTLTDTVGREIADPMPYNLRAQTQTPGERTVALPGFGGNPQNFKMNWSRLRPEGCEASSDPDCEGTDGSRGGALTDQAEKLFYDSRYFCRGSITEDLLAVPGEPGDPSNEVLFPTAEIGVRPCSAFAVTTAINGEQVPAPVRFNPVVLESVTLPDGRSYRFGYNRFGEIARITYPTGVFEEFDHGFVQPFAGTGKSAFDQTNRGVSERRIYSAQGELQQRWTYSGEYNFSPGDDSTYKLTAAVSNSSDAAAEGAKTETILNAFAGGGEFGLGNPLAGSLREIREFDEGGSMRSRKLFRWKSEGPSAGGVSSASRDVRLAAMATVTFEPGSPRSLVTLSRKGYDQASPDRRCFSHLNSTETDTWGYAAVPSGTAASAAIGELEQAVVSAAARLEANRRSFDCAPLYVQRGILGRKASETTVDPEGSGTILNETRFEYDGDDQPLIDPGSVPGWSDPGTAVRGNITKVSRWDAQKQVWLTERFGYDKFGNARKTRDASGDEGNVTEVEYSSEYAFAYPTLLRSPSPDPTGENGSAEPSETAKTYDPVTGLLTSLTDRQTLASESDDRTTRFEYNDPLLRQTAVVEPGGLRRETGYNDAPGLSVVTTRSPAANGGWRESREEFDGFGRKIRSLDVTDEGLSVAEFEHDLHGRLTAATSPHFEGAPEEALSHTITLFDQAGRVAEVRESAGGTERIAVSFAYGISAGSETGTYLVRKDGSGRSVREIRDAGGRIVRADEPASVTGDPANDLGALGSPNLPTFYRYSKRGQLIEVRQGVQRRYFLHDPFGRLIRQRLPEQEPNPDISLPDAETGNSEWTTAFDYDPLGNPSERVDANGTHTSTTFDRLSRPLTIEYSDGTPATAFRYDLVQNGKGRVIESANSESRTRLTEFDAQGRVTSAEQVTNGIKYVTEFGYGADGELNRLTYPSGRTVVSESGTDGRLRRVYGTSGGVAVTYANSVGYDAAGKTTKIKLGNGRWETAGSDGFGRLVMTGLGNSAVDTSLWKAAYEYGEADSTWNIDPGKANGSVAKITVSLEGWPDAFAQTFRYDPVRRVSQARERANGATVWSRRFGYDRFGNRTSFEETLGNSSENTEPSIDPLTNRFANGQGFFYDKNGNVTADPSGNSFVYDARNRQVEVRGPDGSVVGKYFYDADGRRVRTETPLETKVFVYALDRLVAEYSTSAPAEPDTRYLTYDHLESARVVSSGDGRITARRDYSPFGEELVSGTGVRSEALGYAPESGPVDNGFAGYRNDRETGLDFAEARMYDSATGRFTATDPLPASAAVGDPQSLNRYVYARNDPLNSTDPTGLDDWYVADNGSMQVYRTEDPFDRFYVFDENRNVFVLVAQLDKNSRGLVRFPEQGYGFTYYNPGERGGFDPSTGESVGQGDHYLLPVTAAALFGFTNQLKNDEGVTLALGDMSASNGSDPWDVRFRSPEWNGHHATHGHLGNGTGANIDFRYVDSAGNSQRGNWAESPRRFSQAKNQRIFDLARKWGFSKSLRGYSVPVRGTKAAKGHNDHGHLGFDLSRKKPRVLLHDRRRWYIHRLDITLGCDVDVCTNR